MKRICIVPLALTGALSLPSATPQLRIQTRTLREPTFEQSMEFAPAHGIARLDFRAGHLYSLTAIL